MPEKVSEDSNQEIVNFLRRSSLQCPPTADQISSAYRLGKPNDNFTRPILVAFKDQQIKDIVLRNAPSIKKISWHEIAVDQSWPPGDYVTPNF